MDVPLIVAGSLGIIAAAIHGVGGELLVVRKLSRETLPSTALGGRSMTKAMIHATWHMTTIAFLTLGLALLLAGSAFEGDTARAIGVVGAVAFTGFGALGLGLGAAYAPPPRSLRSPFRHPGPALLALTGALAWWGAL